MSRSRRRSAIVYLVGLFGLALLAAGGGLVGTAAADAPTCGDVTYAGSGDAGDPYRVENVSQLQCINGNHGDAASRSDALGANYTLISDVDANETNSWNGEKGFDPIGDSSRTPFTGSFDGQDHTISNLTIDRPGTDRVGLFGQVGPFSGDGGTVSNVSLQDVNVTGNYDVGTLVGLHSTGTLRNVSASGNVTGVSSNTDDADFIGGLVGFSRGTITDASATATVTGSDLVGGLVGMNNNGGLVTNASAAGTVSGSDYVGGLVGENDWIVTNATATASVSGNENVGGLIGYSYLTVNTSEASGDVTGNKNVSALVGWNEGKINQSHASGNVTASSATVSNAGGLAGYNEGNVSNASFTGNVSGKANVGGIAGHNLGNVSDTVTAAKVTGDVDVAQIIGNNSAPLTAVTDNYWDTDIHIDATSSYGTGLTTAEMTGMNVTRNMGNLSFYDTWVPTKGDYPDPASLAGTDGTTEAAFDRYFAGDGTEANPYEIETAPELQAMNDSLAANYTLTSDVDASGTKSWNDGKGFDPVGDSSTRFTGALDGNGHTISNLTVDRPSENAVGLFGELGFSSPATVENVTLAGITVTGGDDTGGLAGAVYWGTIENISVSGTVDGDWGTGGVIGFNEADLRDVSSSGSVNGSSYVGGIVGSNGDATGVISNSSSTSDVNGTQYVGGLAGGLYDFTVRNSFAAGAVTGDSNVGGLWGNEEDVPTVTGSYWDVTATGQDSPNGVQSSETATGLTTAEMTGMNATHNMGNLPFYAAWVPTKGGYPEPASLTGTDGTTEAAFDRYFAGDGTASRPYEIETAPELQAMNDLLTANYTLGNDIDANGTSSWNDGNGFDPVGDHDGSLDPPTFTGSFDGRGYAITGMAVDRPTEEYVGLFGHANSGTFSNVTLTDVDVTGKERTGGLVGYVQDGSVQNVSVSGSVNGTSDVGGLLGYFGGSAVRNSSASVSTTAREAPSGLPGGSESVVGGLIGYVYEGKVKRAHASGAVDAAGDKAGGLVGEYNTGNLSNATASGDVDGDSSVGGLVGRGNGVAVRNVSAVGDVNGSTDIGGLVGLNHGSVERAFATGAVSGDDAVGSLLGDNTGTVTDVYWDNASTGATAASGTNSGSVDATGLSTAEMTGAAAAGNMSTLSFGGAWTTTHGYPVPHDHVTGLSLDLGTTSLTEGDTTDVTVTLSLFGGRTETASMVAEYTTTDASIADVDGGTLAANGPGEATIAASHADASDSIDVDVSAPNAGGGGGGGGATGGAPGTDTGNERTTVEADPTMEDGVAVATVSVSANAEQAVEIQLGPGDDGGRDGAGEGSSETVRATVETLDIEFAGDTEGDVSVSQSASPPAPDGPEFDVDSADPAGYLRVETDIDNEQIARAEIGFRVSRSALDTAGTDAGDVSLYHYDEDAGEWDALSTEISETSDSEVRFTAVTPGFSDFVIGVGDRQPDDDSERSTESSQSTTTSTESSGESATESDRSTGATDTARSNGSPAVFEWVLAMIAVAIAVAVGALAVLWRRNSDI